MEVYQLLELLETHAAAFTKETLPILRMHFLTPESIQIIVLEESALSRRGLTLSYLLTRY